MITTLHVDLRFKLYNLVTTKFNLINWALETAR